MIQDNFLVQLVEVHERVVGSNFYFLGLRLGRSLLQTMLLSSYVPSDRLQLTAYNLKPKTSKHHTGLPEVFRRRIEDLDQAIEFGFCIVQIETRSGGGI